MKREIKTKWVAALRSGDYKQAQGQLATATGYCCLGVLCDLIDPNGWSDYGWYPEGEPEEEDYFLDSELDYETLKLVGLTDEEQHACIALNDTDNANFNQIANWIDENVPEED